MDKEIVFKTLRIFLGLFIILYALNQFFHFVPTSYGQMSEDVLHFLQGVVVYLPYLYIFEIIVGLALVIGKWTPFILIVIFPLSVSFLIFNIANRDLAMMWPALIVASLNIILLIDRKERFASLFQD